MDSPLIFMFFPEPLPETVFRGPKCRSILKGSVLEPFSIFGGSPNRPSDAPFSPKKSKKWSSSFCGGRPGATRDATCDPKRPWNPFLSIWDGFWMDFGWIWPPFWSISTYFSHLCSNVFFRYHAPQTRTPSKNFLKTLARRNARARALNYNII